MNTLSLRVLANSDEEFSKMMRHELRAAADCIDKLRARCRNQRKELKRLNASNARIQAGRNARRQEAFLQQLRGDLDRAVEFTKHLRPTNILARVEDLEKSTERVARFVGAVPVNGGAK